MAKQPTPSKQLITDSATLYNELIDCKPSSPATELQIKMTAIFIERGIELLPENERLIELLLLPKQCSIEDIRFLHNTLANELLKKA